jgi:hypothetical protein
VDNHPLHWVLCLVFRVAVLVAARRDMRSHLSTQQVQVSRRSLSRSQFRACWALHRARAGAGRGTTSSSRTGGEGEGETGNSNQVFKSLIKRQLQHQQTSGYVNETTKAIYASEACRLSYLERKSDLKTHFCFNCVCSSRRHQRMLQEMGRQPRD